MATQEEQIRNFQERIREAQDFWQSSMAHIASGNDQQTYNYQEVGALLSHFNEVVGGSKTADEAKALHGIP